MLKSLTSEQRKEAHTKRRQTLEDDMFKLETPFKVQIDPDGVLRPAQLQPLLAQREHIRDQLPTKSTGRWHVVLKRDTFEALLDLNAKWIEFDDLCKLTVASHRPSHEPETTAPTSLVPSYTARSETVANAVPSPVYTADMLADYLRHQNENDELPPYPRSRSLGQSRTGPRARLTARQRRRYNI